MKCLSKNFNYEPYWGIDTYYRRLISSMLRPVTVGNMILKQNLSIRFHINEKNNK